MPRSPKPFRTRAQLAQRRAAERRRGSRHERGYDAKWVRYREIYLKTEGNQFCRACLAKGKYVAAKHVDHIKAVRGPDDPLFWAESNHQPLCHPCHSRKTVREDGGFGR